MAHDEQDFDVAMLIQSLGECRALFRWKAEA
ncbi:hypothetical protein GGI59_006049 [Rhizobium lentis]|uniref:Uncharacterized protein n=1 Tax=Rhizobium lentis TaxID=1138194 RepID=A0A7W8XK81_9HYPH|nr:hypothetical protein [Rhizobium lentis]MBB5553780.1 hypothetical protein [Rhizobium lentis]MBB5564341.1 hypothetical protein [Rhizobium lentis]MBB5570859.1 hypothetical protein [Rhizobium lentis]